MVRQTKRALIADDCEGQRRYLGAVLCSLGFKVEFAQNGHEAVQSAERTSFDLILVDLAMRTMDGLLATRSIRKSERLRDRHPSVLYIVSSQDERVCSEAARQAGANGFISKPASLPELVSAAKRALAPRDTPMPDSGVIIELSGPNVINTPSIGTRLAMGH